MFSLSCEYAFQALLHIASSPRWQHVRLVDIAEKYDLPFHFLNKVLQMLVKNGLLISRKGPSGGFMLAKPASEITLLDVVCAIKGYDFLERCLLELPFCRESEPCPMHEVKKNIHSILKQQTIAEILEKSSNQRDFDLSHLNQDTVS